MVNSEFLFFDIIKLYKSVTSLDKVEISKLEKAFYTFLGIINNRLGLSLNYVFDEELSKLEDNYEGLFDIDEDGVGFIDVDDELIEKILVDKLGNDNYNYVLTDYIHNMCIYNDLGLEIPINDYQRLFGLNASILNAYSLLAKYESSNKDTRKLLVLLKSLSDYLVEVYFDLHDEDVPKIKVIVAYLNDAYLLDSDNSFANANWYIALFSKNNWQKNALNYNRLMYYNLLLEDGEFRDEEEEDEEEKEVMMPEENVYYLNEVDLLVYNYTVLLNRYIKEVSDKQAREILIEKKYLLIAIQTDIEAYLIDKGTIDDLDLTVIKKEWLSESSFMSFYPLVADFIFQLNIPDKDIDGELYADIITKAIFVRTFLGLCINEDILNEIKMGIAASRFYKNENYQIITKIIDDIIFKEKGWGLTRHNDN